MFAVRTIKLTILIVSLSLLCLPAAGEDEMREVEFKGVIEQLPAGTLIGDWIVAGMVVRVSSQTGIESEKGRPAAGALITVKGKQDDGGIVYAKEMKVEQPAAGSPPEEGESESAPGSGKWTLIGWNDLGMHCMDGKDYSVMTVLPPANTFVAQVITPDGELLTRASGVRVTYEAVADPAGSINTTSRGKTNFWDYVEQLFGVAPKPDQGLAGARMPGRKNRPRRMRYDRKHHWFAAEWTPITPYDDSGRKNYYPLMKLVARDSAGIKLAETKVVLPVSDEMDCRQCHASGSVSAAMPDGGWVFDSDAEKDYKLNVLKLHDSKRMGDAAYGSALAQAGFNGAGLLASVRDDKKPVLCQSCHASKPQGMSPFINFTPNSTGNGSQALTPLWPALRILPH